jgi:hypothetical protein
MPTAAATVATNPGRLHKFEAIRPGRDQADEDQREGHWDQDGAQDSHGIERQ